MNRQPLENARRELRRAADAVEGGARDPIASMDETLGGMVESGDEPKLDRLNEMEDELSKLAADADPEAREPLEKARGHIAEYRKAVHRER